MIKENNLDTKKTVTLVISQNMFKFVICTYQNYCHLSVANVILIDNSVIFQINFLFSIYSI